MTSQVTRRAVVLAALAAIAILVVVVAAVAVVGQARIDRLSGYYSPIYGDEGRSVYFIKRETVGLSFGLGYEHFTPPAHAYALDDTMSLRRLDLASGAVETLKTWPETPYVGRRVRHYRGRLYGTPQTLLRLSASGGLDYAITLAIVKIPASDTYQIWRRWDGADGSDEWVEGRRQMSGGDESPLHGAVELFTVPGPEGYPSAIVAYDHDADSFEVLLQTDEFDDRDMVGLARQRILERSRRADIERLAALERSRTELLEGFGAEGMNQGEAMLATDKELRRLGFYPPRPTITAREVTGAAADGEVPLFEIADGEMRSGVFPDIEQAVASPGEAIDKTMGNYVIHHDYQNSARLNAFLDGGGARFRVRFAGSLYELTVDRP